MTHTPHTPAQHRDHLNITVAFDPTRAAYVAEVDAPVLKADPFTGEVSAWALECEGHSPTVAALNMRRALRERGALAPSTIRAAI